MANRLSSAVCTGTAPATFVTPTAVPTVVSFVPNGYFSFPYAATYFANAGQCTSAVSQCSANYDSCTTALVSGSSGGSFGVTIIVPGGGGTTVAPGVQAGGGVGITSATSICSSLSSVACGGLQLSMCTNSGVTVSGFYFGTGAANAAARPTGVCHGVGVGVAGMVAAGVGLGILNGI
jgi:hypothetical protein